jgi:hypothetical protein
MFKNDKQTDNDKKIQIRSNTLDEGIYTFGQWLYSKDNSQRWDNKLVLKQFVKCSHALLQDNTTGISIDVFIDVFIDLTDGIPICRSCHSNDCAHVRFTICVKQMNIPNGIMDT